MGVNVPRSLSRPRDAAVDAHLGLLGVDLAQVAGRRPAARWHLDVGGGRSCVPTAATTFLLDARVTLNRGAGRRWKGGCNPTRMGSGTSTVRWRKAKVVRTSLG